MRFLVKILLTLSCALPAQGVVVTGKYPVILEEPLGDAEMGRIDVMERAVEEAADTAGKATSALLVKGLGDPSRFVQYKALEFFGRYRDPDTVPALIDNLRARQTEVDEQVIAILFASSRSGVDPNQPIVSSCVPMLVLAIAALAHQGGIPATQTLVAIARERKVERTPGAIVRALGEGLAKIGTYETMLAATKWEVALSNALTNWEKGANKKKGTRPEWPLGLGQIYSKGELATNDDQSAIRLALAAAFRVAGAKPPPKPDVWSDWSGLLAKNKARFPAAAPK